MPTAARRAAAGSAAECEPGAAPSLAALGERVVIIGPSCSGKSTLGERLSERIGAPFVELDALYWKPGWQETRDDEFQERIRDATSGARWVVAGNYRRHTRNSVWPRAETIVWLDFPMGLVLRRIITRSWRRSRRRELLWGTNYERFWRQLKLWNERDSLIAYTWRNYPDQARDFAAAMYDPALSHVRFVRFRSPKEAQALA